MPDRDAIPLPDHVRAFLEEVHAASVATVDPDGAPRQTVAWYRLERDGRVLLNSRLPRRWQANLRRDGRLAISVIDAADPYRWLGLTAEVDEVVDDVPTGAGRHRRARAPLPPRRAAGVVPRGLPDPAAHLVPRPGDGDPRPPRGLT